MGTLRNLEGILQIRASKVHNLTLLTQVRLAEEEYQETLPNFQFWLSHRDRIVSVPHIAPLGYCRMLSELTARCFVPRSYGSPSSSGLWQNLYSEITGVQPGHVIGLGFERSIKNLRKQYSAMFLGEFQGWRYVGNLLTHAGIPVTIVGTLVNALRRYINSGKESVIERIDGVEIEKLLKQQVGMNKYTISVLSQTTEGVRLVQQFLRLCHFVLNGGVPKHDVFSKSFIRTVQDELKGRVTRPCTVAYEIQRPRFVFDDSEKFIGWVISSGEGHHALQWYITGMEGEHQLETKELDTGLLGIPVLPERTVMKTSQVSSVTKCNQFIFDPADIMFFSNRNGELIEQSELLRGGLAAGEYLVLAARQGGVLLEERFRPMEHVTITEKDILLPSGWRRKYRGYRVYLPHGDGLQVLIGPDRWIPLQLRHHGGNEQDLITLGSEGAAYLYAYHSALPNERIPVFCGETLPALHFWGEEQHCDLPEIQLSCWTNNNWRPIHDVTMRLVDNATIILCGRGLQGLIDNHPSSLHLIRLAFYDLSYHPLNLPDQHFIWIPGAHVANQVGLLPQGMSAKLSINLVGEWSAKAAIGTVQIAVNKGHTQVLHQLPSGLRKARFKIRSVHNPLSRATLEWRSLGAAVVSVQSGTEAPKETDSVALPIEAMGIEKFDALQRLDLAWWPAMTASLVCGTKPNLLANIFFDCNGTATVHMLDLVPTLRDEVSANYRVTLGLSVYGRCWPILDAVSDVRQPLRQAKYNAKPPNLARLLWECELVIANRGLAISERKLARLREQLSELQTQSVAIRFMKERLEAKALVGTD